MQLQNYFYFDGVPYQQLSFVKRSTIDRLIERIKHDRLFERITLYQDHFFNIIQEANDRRQFQTDLPEDVSIEIVKAYLKTTDWLKKSSIRYGWRRAEGFVHAHGQENCYI